MLVPAALLLLLCLLFTCSSSSSRSSSHRFAPLSVAEAAKLADCCCDLETIDLGNDAVMYNRLQKLRVSAAAAHTSLE